MSDRLRNPLIWLLILMFALFNTFKPAMPGTFWVKLLPAVSILSMLGFVMLHGPRQIGWRNVAIFFVIASVVSWCFESLSIATGFPFGHYHYTDKMGPKLGTVPMLIMPAYYAVCYVSWHLALVVLDRYEQRGDPVQTWLVPVLAAFIMVMWDMSMDPARSTLAGSWIWRDGGAYFGVPLANFLGWFLTVWTIFQLYALYLRKPRGSAGVLGTNADRKQHWLQMTALYAALFLEFLAFAAFPPSGTVTDKAGFTWNVKDMYETLGLVALFSMVFVALLATIKIALAPRPVSQAMSTPAQLSGRRIPRAP